MKQILYVTSRPRGSGVGGREQLSLLHGQALKEIFGYGFERIELDGTSRAGKLFGYLDGVSTATINLVCNRIVASRAKQVFLDGSNLGRLAEGIKKCIPDIQIVTFFHNCETRFFLGALKRSRSPKALAVLISNYLAERSAVRFSDKRICLNQRDGDQLLELFGRGATHISAMAIVDRLPAEMPASESSIVERYALFVGGAFYANRYGIEWYVDNVVVSAPMKTYVIGKGFERWKARLERNGNVEVVGSVESLEPWYLAAHCVIAPIFDGSGMKTKVAEALMFGKRVVGTREAFAGYESIVSRVGECCETADQFLSALAGEMERPFVEVDPELRSIYEDRYSLWAARDRLGKILAHNVNNHDCSNDCTT